MNDTPTPDNPFHCVVNFDLFRRALTIASVEEQRPYITGVYVEPHPAGGALLVATDGHRLVCLRDASAIASGTGGIVRLKKSTLRDAKTDPGSGYRLRLVVSGNRASVVSPRCEGEWLKPEFKKLASRPNASVVAHQWDGVVVNAAYPEWRRVVPTPQSEAPTAPINADLIGTLARALVGDDDHAPIRIVRGEGPKAIPLQGPQAHEEYVGHLVFPPQHHDGFGVIMPMRSSIEAALPSWFGGAV